MASEDVIELGSSDDEAEPASKKMKPVPNAMVHIPTKLPGLTIKPTKSNVTAKPNFPLKSNLSPKSNLAAVSKVLAGKNVTVTKITKSKNVVSNPFSIPNKTNGQKVAKTLKTPSLPKAVYNPLHFNMKKMNSPVILNRTLPSNNLKQPIKIMSPRSINNLPPSITITKTSGAVKRTDPVNNVNPVRSGGLKRTGPVSNVNLVRKKQKLDRVSKPAQGEVMTVELDDDDAASVSAASPLWYVRPEEQAAADEINNKEPEKPAFVEITIEDSPVKPSSNKRTCEVGAVLSVTIEDSPVKNIVAKNAGGNSGSESDVQHQKNSGDKHSKKRLEYPKKVDQESNAVGKTIEIEVPPCDENMATASNSKQTFAIDVIEIEESPLKIQSENTNTSTPKKDHSKARLETAMPVMKELQENDELSEFHPVYRDFIKLCFELENSEDMKKIVEKKIKTYYRQVPKTYTESEEFIDMVSSKILAIKAGPEKMYLYIKDIVDELNMQRKVAKSQLLSNIEAKVSGSDSLLYGEESEFDTKRLRQIRKLEKTLKKLHRAIQKLEEQEVDFDDDEDSVYLLTESDEGCTASKDNDKGLEKDPKSLLQRYKERMVRVHAKFCQLTNTKMPSEPRVQIDARPGQPQGPAKRLEKWVNKKVPIGTPLPFPDFHDVLRCVREANEEDNLGWNEADIMEEARDLFTRCGKKLQRRRQENEWRLAASRITADVDPAEKSEELKRKLEENKKMATKKETDVFNKYADRQKQLQLEPEEIGDKEADESPIESEEDEPVDESPLQSTEKRKERLKRLLQEKSKKVVEEQPLKEPFIKDKKNEVENGKKSEEKSNENYADAVDSKDKPKSPEQEDKDEANKENQVSITAEETVTKSDDKSKIDENASASKSKSQDNLEKDSKLQEDGKIHSLSDDSNQLESDVDELHLLQKLHSENEMCSTSEHSCSDTPIAISDTLGSSEDNKKPVSDDVISIENSSYSESEENHVIDKNDKEEKKLPDNVQVDKDLTHDDTEMECSSAGVVKQIVKTNNEEYNESIEDILLASTDDEAEVEKDYESNKGSVNLKDDTLSIGDTLIEKLGDTEQKQEDSSSVESVTLVSVTEAGTEETKKKEEQSDASSINDVMIEELGEKTANKQHEDSNSVGSVVSVKETEAEEAKEKIVAEENNLAKSFSVEKKHGIANADLINVISDNDSKDAEHAEKKSETSKVTNEDSSVSVTEAGAEETKKKEEQSDASSINDVMIEELGETTANNNLQQHEDSNSVGSVVSVKETEAEGAKEKIVDEENNLAKSSSVEKNHGVANADSINVISDNDSKDAEHAEKKSETSKVTNDDSKELPENKNAANLDENGIENTTELTEITKSADNKENATDCLKETIPANSETVKDKKASDDSGIVL